MGDAWVGWLRPGMRGVWGPEVEKPDPKLLACGMPQVPNSLPPHSFLSQPTTPRYASHLRSLSPHQETHRAQEDKCARITGMTAHTPKLPTQLHVDMLQHLGRCCARQSKKCRQISCSNRAARGRLDTTGRGANKHITAPAFGSNTLPSFWARRRACHDA